MAPNGAFHPSFHSSSHIDQFLSHDVPEANYDPFDMNRQHHHCLPIRNDGLAHLSQSTHPELMASLTTMVEQEGTPEPGSRPKGPKLKFSAQEDEMLIDLKENRNLTWRRIAEFFPGRTSGTLQVRYCTKLKEKTVIWTEENVTRLLLSLLEPLADNLQVQRLRKALADYENDKWRVIAAKVGNSFSPTTCQEKAEELEYEEEYEEANSSDSLPAFLGPSQPYTSQPYTMAG